jgi:hypothetical protein
MSMIFSKHLVAALCNVKSRFYAALPRRGGEAWFYVALLKSLNSI